VPGDAGLRGRRRRAQAGRDLLRDRARRRDVDHRRDEPRRLRQRPRAPGASQAGRPAVERHIRERADFGLIRYASCWEDADVLCAALQPAAGKRILSIASAGDNALALVAEGAEVVAVDLSPAQLACVELRCAGFRRLAHEELLGFLGVAPAADRAATYARLRADLSGGAAAFWDAHPDWIRRGAVHAGRFERYFEIFRTRVLPLIHGRRAVLELLREKGRDEREAFYAGRWDNRRWRWLFRLFFGRFAMGRLGRDPEFFRYVEGSVAERILARTRHALTALPTHSNPYLRSILTGSFAPALPRYLRPENHARVRAGLARLALVRGSVEEAAAEHAGARGFDGFNLSDIFEYLDPGTCRAIYGELLRFARPGARLAYWNMLVPRRAPPEHAGRVRHLAELSRDLLEQDRAFFYSAFVVEEVA
jgi:S-adenosylmethionine-diacylglycerol 3-amino-3-carboxypropyl transferase